MTGPVIQTRSPDLEGRVEAPRELRTEKPWRDGGGPEFDSRRLHQMMPLVDDGQGFSACLAGCVKDRLVKGYLILCKAGRG